jgi:hypothetical protein
MIRYRIPAGHGRESGRFVSETRYREIVAGEEDDEPSEDEIEDWNLDDFDDWPEDDMYGEEA